MRRQAWLCGPTPVLFTFAAALVGEQAHSQPAGPVGIVPGPTRQPLRVQLRFAGMVAKPTKAIVRLKPEHVDPEDALVLREAAVTEFTDGNADMDISVQNLTPGRYRVGVDVFRGGDLVLTVEEMVERLANGTVKVVRRPRTNTEAGTGAPRPDMPDRSQVDVGWLADPVATEALRDDCVLPPFVPVRVSSGGTVEVWNRAYALGAWGLPNRVTTQNASILAGPVTFSVVSGAKDVMPRNALPSLVSRARGVVRYRAAGESRLLSATVECRIEFDGFALYTVRLSPKAELHIDSITLRVPVRAQHAAYLWAGGLPTERTTTGPIQLDRGFSRTLSEDGVLWRSPFKEQVWLGDDDRGLEWFCESEEFWHPQAYPERRNALQVEKRGDIVFLRVSFVSAPKRLNRPTRYTFGFMATPVRPKPKGWRGWRLTLGAGLFNIGLTKGLKGNLLLYWPRGMWDRFYLSPLIGDEAKYRQTALADHAEGRTVLPYLAPQVSGAGLCKTGGRAGKHDPSKVTWKEKDPILLRYATEWQTLPVKVGHQKRGDYDSPAYYVCPMSRWADYAVWLMQKHARCGADGIGILDGGSGPCKNRDHGCGYVDAAGTVKATYSGIGVRNMCKRLLYMFVHERGKERRRITGLGLDHVHGGNGKVAFGGSFFDAALKGEDMNSGYYLWPPSEKYRKKIGDGKYYYANMLPLEKFRIEFMGHQWGWVPVFMPQLKKSPRIDKAWAASPEGARDFLVLTLLHDSLVYPYWCNPRAVYDTWLAKDKFGIADDGVEFLPYWRNSEFVSSSRDNVKVSLYRKPGKIMVVVGNLAKTSQAVTVKLVLAQLWGPDRQAKRVFNAVTDAPITLADGVLELRLPPRDYKLVILEG